MLSWPPTVRIFLHAGPTDMRKGFDSLAHLVESSLALDSLSGHLFVFGVGAAIGLRSCTGTEMGTRCGISDWKEEASASRLRLLHKRRKASRSRQQI